MTRHLQVTAGLLLCCTLCLSTPCLVAPPASIGCVPPEDAATASSGPPVDEGGTPWPVVTMLLGGAAAFAAAGVVALGRSRSGDRGRARPGWRPPT